MTPREYFLADKPVKPEVPGVRDLRKRIDRLLESEFMLQHLAVQVYRRQREVEQEEARIPRTLRGRRRA